MYAIFAGGSRQFRVSEGQRVTVDFRRDATASAAGDLTGLKPGTAVELNRVLLYKNGDDLRIGKPILEGVRILAEVAEHPSTKTYIGKYRRRKNYRRLRGHRQYFTTLKINHILLPGQEPKAKA